MTQQRRGTRVGRPWRHLRRWVQHTPNADMAIQLIALGITLTFAAILLAFFVL